MKRVCFALLFFWLPALTGFTQSIPVAEPFKTPVMTLGVFHFEYPNLDAVKVAEEDQISVLDEPFRSEVMAICEAIRAFSPTIVAVETNPANQSRIDSLYNLYLNGAPWEMPKDETYQLGFRIGKMSGTERIYAVDDRGRPYDHIVEILDDPLRLQRFEDHFENTQDTVYYRREPAEKVKSIIEELLQLNDPEYVKDRLSVYLLDLFKYEETAGDFTGVDFESGRWFNRNLRIFRNIQRIPRTPQDRILVIIGADHLNLLNPLFDVSREYELVSPVPYLEQALKQIDRN